jgi:2-dehydro-3-deoxyphosphooctonate aldolase (KDO 8-P synthase)
VAARVDALFLEVHDHPDQALSDGPNSLPLAELPELLEEVLAVDAVARRFPPPNL